MDTLTLHKPEETLALIPHLIGFRPTHHLVFLGFDGPGPDRSGERVGIGPLMVLDLDESGVEPDVGIALSRAVRQYGVSQAVLVLYTRDLCEDLPVMSCGLLNVCAIVSDAMLEAEEGFFACFVADHRHWADFGGPDLELGNREELEASPAAAAMVYAGSAPADSPPSFEIVRMSDEQRAQAKASGTAWLAALEEDLLAAGSKVWDRVLALWSERGARDRLLTDTTLLGKANAALSSVEIRDRLLMWSTNPLEGSLSTIDEEKLTTGLAGAVLNPPPVDHLEVMTALFDACASVAADDDPVALACSAYCLWWFGQNTRAAVRLEEALAADPKYKLAQLLMDAVSAAVLPLWLSGNTKM